MQETMQERLVACLSRKLITLCPCSCYMVTEKGKELLKSHDIEKDIKHVLDTQLGRYIFREPDREIEQDYFIEHFWSALEEKVEAYVKERIHNTISDISDKELITRGAGAIFVFIGALDMARNFGYVYHKGENKLELMDPGRFFKEKENLVEVIKR